MRTALAIGFLTAGLLAAAPEARAYQVYYGFSTYPSGYWGGYPGYYSSFYAPGVSLPPYPAPAYAGGIVPVGPYPAYYGGFGYSYSYFTHVPGYSFSYYRGRLPRYYPGPYGGLGYYGYGPYGW